jgi:hypothetical protein
MENQLWRIDPASAEGTEVAFAFTASGLLQCRSVQNYETADSGRLITRGRTYETLTLAAAGVAEENLSLVDEVQHLSGNSSKAITSTICPMMDPLILRASR